MSTLHPGPLVLAVALSVLAASCGGDGDGSTPEEATSTTAAPSVTSAAPSPTTGPSGTGPAGTGSSDPGRSDGGCSMLVSSPAQFDARAGQYAAYLTGVEVARRTLAFDVIQFLGGEDAERAYRRQNPDDAEGPPNDYLVVNESLAVRQATVATAVRVRLLRDGSAELDQGTFEDLPAHLAADGAEGGRPAASPYWLTFEAGAVTDICEQYVP